MGKLRSRSKPGITLWTAPMDRVGTCSTSHRRRRSSTSSGRVRHDGGVEELKVTNGDITLRVEVTGDGPTVLCVSGWPELAGSWHNQVEFLSSHGYRVAALDVRGYGGSSVPTEVERYTLKELTGDIAAVATALSDEPIVLVGHDWGAPIVWNTAIRHPDRVRAVAGLSVAHIPAMGMSLIDVFDQVYAGRFFYSLYFIRPGEPEADFGADLRGALKRATSRSQATRRSTAGSRTRRVTWHSSLCSPTRPTVR